MKLRFLCFLFPGLLLSCQNKAEQQEPIRSSGNINSLSVVIADPLWNGECGDSIRKKLAAPVDGLPQEEPLFNIDQYNIQHLDGVKSLSRNLVIVAQRQPSQFKIVRDEFSVPQLVVHISGTQEEIIGHLEIHSDSIIRTLKSGEIAVSQTNMAGAALDDGKIRKKFGVSLLVPADYDYAMEKRHFLWLKKDFRDGSASILIYKVPVRNIRKHGDYISNITRARDSIGRLYIHGKARRSRMITEESYSPYFRTTSLDGKTAYETKGTWELRNDFMNGPFINYAIADRKSRYCLVIEGFCYAPSAKKRDIMHELEAVIRSVRDVRPKK